MKPVIIADSHIPFLQGVLEPYAKVIYAEKGVISRQLALQADGLIIRTRTRCDAGLLEGTPVRFIATATIGYDHIDTAYCQSTGIQWNYAPGCNASSVNQYIASVLAWLSTQRGYRLQEKNIGVIGVGNVGGKVAQLSHQLGMVPLLNDPPRERLEGTTGFIELEDILENADVITLHVPLNCQGPDKTHHLVNEAFFSRMKKKPVLINTARGPVVDTRAVKQAIRMGQVSGYIADVWENEPNLDTELMKISDIATPHIAGYSVEGKANGTAACIRAASRFFGFGIDDWVPGELPPPHNPIIRLNSMATNEQLIGKAILAAYDVRKDDAALRADPASFESLRNHYPVRREFGAFTVESDRNPNELWQSLTALGFKIADH